MREAIVQMLAGDADVSNIVAARVFERAGIFGGVSRQETPTAFDADGDLLPSLVVALEARTIIPGMHAPAGQIAASQSFIVYGVCAPRHTYQTLKDLGHAVRAVLHDPARRGISLTAVSDEGITWRDVTWTATSPELVDEPLSALMVWNRFAATILERFTP